MEFTTEEKKKLNAFLDKYEYLLQQDDYVTFLKEYRKQNKTDSLYYAFVDLIKEIFHLNIEWFIKNDPNFYWSNYFENGSNITHINIPDSVTTIDMQAFYGCSNLKTVTISENSQLTSIGSYAFSDCSNLATVTISESSQLTTIGSFAFAGCSSLTSIYIPDSVTTIGSYAFSDCSNLATVTISESSQLTTIGSFAFYYCSSLTSIYIPDSVTTIERHAFKGCFKLTIYCEASSEPSGWHPDWNPSNRPVVWGYKKK